MRRALILSLALLGPSVVASHALAQVGVAAGPATKPARPGFRMVDQRWVKPQWTLSLNDLVTLEEESGRHLLVSRPAKRAEPLLQNWRTSVGLLERSDYAWKLSAVRRQWNDNRSGPSQHLQLVASSDDLFVDATFRLTKVTIDPGVSTVQAAVVEDGVPLNVLVVLADDYAELAVNPLGKSESLVVLRGPTARDIARDHPIETRRFFVPTLKLLAACENPLQPAAGDVYRAFPDVPADAQTLSVVRALVTDLASPDPAIRDGGLRELKSLGRKGVRAAMAIDRDTIPFDAADRLAAVIAAATVDPRTPAQLRASPAFLADCLEDPDPLVTKAAGEAVGKMK